MMQTAGIHMELSNVKYYLLKKSELSVNRFSGPR